MFVSNLFSSKALILSLEHQLGCEVRSLQIRPTSGASKGGNPMNKRCEVNAISVNALELLDELFLKQVLTECVMMRLRHTAMV